MTEYDYIEALGGGSFKNMACTMTTTMEVEFTFMTTGYPHSNYQSQGHFFVLGGSGGDVVLRGQDIDQYWYAGGDWFMTEEIWTLNEEHTATWSGSQYTFDEYTHYLSGSVRRGAANLSINSLDAGVRIVKVKVKDGGVVVNEFVGADNNGTVGLWDKTNDIFYQPTSGTWSTGSYDNFEADKYEVDFTYAGGTDTITVSADYAWTCNTPTDFTLSPTSGTAGDTTVTVTAGRSSIDKTNTVTFDDGIKTFDVVIKQTGDGSLFPFAKIIRGTRRIN